MVGLTIVIIITGIVAASYFMLPAKLSRKEGAFLFMILLNIIIDATWIITEELKVIVISQKLPEYVAFLLYRSVTIPFDVLFFLSLLLKGRSPFYKIGVVLGQLLSLLLVEGLLLRYKIIEYAQWYFSYSAISYLIVMMLACTLLGWYRYTLGREKAWGSP